MPSCILYVLKYLSIGLFCIYIPAQAFTIAQKMPSLSLTAEANYVAGEQNKPAVLILHGFLTTNQFHTITSIANFLQSEGFSTLAPTLTLNISQRRNLLKCNSLHTHTLERDIVEIEYWVQWLHTQGHDNIILIGHSNGSLGILEYIANQPNTAVSNAIFTSLFYLNGPELGILPNEIESARMLLKNRINKPSNYHFLFCNNQYYATPQSFLSYLKMDRAYTLSMLKHTKIPSYTIMGGADKRFKKVGREWLNELESTPTNLIIIEGANHFFSNEYEFDLQDTLLKTLNAPPLKGS
jgi:esterase/lipase